MSTYTVIGYWNDSDRRIVTGVVRGFHQVTGGFGAGSFGPFAVSVQADSPGDADGLVNGTGPNEEF
jgi:hypothetical protein